MAEILIETREKRKEKREKRQEKREKRMRLEFVKISAIRVQ